MAADDGEYRPTNPRWQRRWRAFRPYITVALSGLALLVLAGLLEYPPWDVLLLPHPARFAVGGALRSVGGAALVASVIAPFITRKVQRGVNQKLLQRVFDTLLGVDVPDWFARPMARYIESIRRVTHFRSWHLSLDKTTDVEALKVSVESTGHGLNVSKKDFIFEDLQAPASVGPYKTVFNRVVLQTWPGGRPHWLTLEGAPLAESEERDEEGRQHVDLRLYREAANVKPEDEYRLDQNYTVYLPTTWTYLLESFGAHREQTIEIRGGALRELDIRVLHANEQLRPRVMKDGSLFYTIPEPTFPGQTTVVAWRPKKTSKTTRPTVPSVSETEGSF